MNADELQQRFGDEYPDAVTVLGVRMTRSSEGRFPRTYSSMDGKTNFLFSRFRDGTAAITLSQLREEWPNWSDVERLEFCNACKSLSGNREFADMLRFVMGAGDHEHRSAVALSVAGELPQEEAFAILTDALKKAPGNTANVLQAIAATKHADAEGVLREHLDALWRRAELWEDDSFSNWTAFDATCCVKHLLSLGVSPSELEEMVRSLSRHVCAGNRRSCANYLHPYYEWLQALDPPELGA